MISFYSLYLSVLLPLFFFFILLLFLFRLWLFTILFLYHCATPPVCFFTSFVLLRPSPPSISLYVGLPRTFYPPLKKAIPCCLTITHMPHNASSTPFLSSSHYFLFPFVFSSCLPFSSFPRLFSIYFHYLLVLRFIPSFFFCPVFSFIFSPFPSHDFSFLSSYCLYLTPASILSLLSL